MSDTTIKVLTYNIHKGFSTSNRHFILHDIKESLRLVDADVLLLQETPDEATVRYFSDIFGFNFFSNIIRTSRTLGSVGVAGP